MICIAHDLKDDRWLRYILLEFGRICGARFEFRTIPVGSESAGDNVIYYTRTAIPGGYIPNRAGTDPDGQTERLDDSTFIHQGTASDAAGALFHYDIFWNIFVNLSRYEEYLAEKRGHNLNSYCMRHPRRDRTTFHVPIVNIMFSRLKAVLEGMFPGAEFGPEPEPGIECSHDVDYIRKTLQLRLKQTAFNLYNVLKSSGHPRTLPASLGRLAAFVVRNPDYRQFRYWAACEREAGRRSVFYVYAGGAPAGLRTWLIDPQYRVDKDRELADELKRLLDDGFEIGLHGSIRSATDSGIMQEEKERLEKSVGTQVIRVRQHWLAYREKTTPYIHECCFRYDSTLGWNDVPGFRSGCYSRFHPYDHDNQRPFRHFVIPQIVMDANVFEYGRQDFSSRKDLVLNMVGTVSRDPAAHAAISWHLRTCTPDYNWHHLYNELLAAAERHHAA